MNRLPRSPVVVGWLLLYAGVAAAGVFWWVRLQERARRDLAALEQKQQERAWLARQSPAPDVANEKAILAELHATQQELAAVRLALQGRDAGLLASAPPAKPVEAYFALAGFVERTRALAARLQVRCAPGEHFGFATYAQEGPEPARVPAVHRQRLVVQHLVETLLEARPRELLRVQRARPASAAARASGAEDAAALTEVPADFFAPEERLSLRTAGLVEGESYRLEFTGQTVVLRTFLNALAAFRLPVVVRSVEVEPLETPPGDPSTVVAASWSRFVVVLEFVEVLPAPAAPPS